MKHRGKCVLYLALCILELAASGCMVGGHHGGGGGGGGNLAPGPTLSSISPSSVTAGGPPFALTVNGSGFVPGGSLTWNGNFLGQYIFVSSTQVTIQVGSNMITSPGSALIVASIGTMNLPSNALTLNVNPFTSAACVLFGLYDFFFTGFDSSGPVTIAGAFGVDASGNVTGEEDFKDLAGTRTAEPITGGSCTNSSTANEGTLTLLTAAETSTYTFATQAKPALGVKGQIAESGGSNGISGCGRFGFVPSISYFTGSYVLAMMGADSSGARMGLLGAFIDNTTSFSTPGTINNAVWDMNDNGAVTSNVSFAGSVSVPDLYSRSLLNLTAGSQTLNLAVYVLTSSSGFGVDADSGGSSPLLAGFVGVQANPGLYSNSDLSAPVIFSTWGAGSAPPESDTSIGIASDFNSSAGSFNIQLDAVDNGIANLNQTITAATYSIANNGRATMSYLSGGQTRGFVLYLDNFNDGYILSTSGNTVDFGFLEAQATGPFDTSSMNGNFAGGTWFTPVSTSPNFTGTMTFNNGSISGDVSGAYVVGASGRGTATINLPVLGSDNLVFYIIAPNNFMVMGSDPVSNDAMAFFHL
jgi:hypothetical protein